MAETLDFTRPLSELMDTHPSLREDLKELDIEVEDPTETIPQLAKRLDVGLPIIAMALEASGYTVEGYDPKDDEGAADSPLPDLIAALFGVDRNGNPLPDPDFSQESLCSSTWKTLSAMPSRKASCRRMQARRAAAARRTLRTTRHI